MKFFGYVLIATGSMLLSANGFGLDTWQWWAIVSSFLIGKTFVDKG